MELGSAQSPRCRLCTLLRTKVRLVSEGLVELAGNGQKSNLLSCAAVAGLGRRLLDGAACRI